MPPTGLCPRWFPGLHAGMLGVLGGLGVGGWVLGMEMMTEALANHSGMSLKLAAMGTSIAPYPLILALGVGTVLVPWMYTNRRHADTSVVRPAPAIAGLGLACAGLLGMGTVLGALGMSDVLQTIVRELTPQPGWLPTARTLALLAIPAGLLNMLLAMVAGVRSR